MPTTTSPKPPSYGFVALVLLSGIIILATCAVQSSMFSACIPKYSPWWLGLLWALAAILILVGVVLGYLAYRAQNPMRKEMKEMQNIGSPVLTSTTNSSIFYSAPQKSNAPVSTASSTTAIPKSNAPMSSSQDLAKQEAELSGQAAAGSKLPTFGINVRPVVASSVATSKTQPQQQQQPPYNENKYNDTYSNNPNTDYNSENLTEFDKMNPPPALLSNVGQYNTPYVGRRRRRRGE